MIKIPKRPEAPEFAIEDIEHITRIVFGEEAPIPGYDSMLLFGGSHPGLWETAIAQYRERECGYVFVTGGHKETAIRHETWEYGNQNEADVICRKLVEGGIPGTKIIMENRSTNSYENIAFIKEEISGRGVGSLLCICKCYGVGRQARTIKKQIPSLSVSFLGFDTNIDSFGNVTRHEWNRREEWRSLVWGEYLRNYVYSRQGGILNDFEPTPGIRPHLDAWTA